MNTTTLTSKRVLVTGGGGFIGAHIVPRLIDMGAEVTVAEVSGTLPWRLAAHSGAYMLTTVDIADTQAMSAVFSAVRPHAVVHLAAYGMDNALQDVSEAVRVNVSGTANVLAAMHKGGCPRIVMLGSSAEYGNHDGPIGEDAALRPESVYGSTKAAATLIAHQYAAQHGIGIVTLRPFGVYGGAEQPHSIFCRAILAMLRGLPLDLSPCMQQRDCCYAGDIADAVAMSLGNESLKNNIFNLGSGEMHSLHHCIETIRRMCAPDAVINYGTLPYSGSEIWAPVPDLRRARERLGWQSSHSLEGGLEKTIAWYRENAHHYPD